MVTTERKIAYSAAAGVVVGGVYYAVHKQSLLMQMLVVGVATMLVVPATYALAEAT